jgi:23S rRNA pseudouridine1911/1915/1917 synthase
MKKTNYTFTVREAGERLDVYLSAQLPDISRSQIKKMILNGDVKVNEEQPTVHYFIKRDDIVSVSTLSQDIVVKKIPINYTVIAKTDDYIIINKPAGVIVHPFEGIGEYSLIEAVTEEFPEIQDVGEDSTRPGIVHRLDKDVSGLMVIARTNTMFYHLKNQFKDRKVEKEYLALVHGEMEQYEGRIDFPIARSQSKRHKMAAYPVGTKNAKDALTHYRVIKKYGDMTLLNVTIETGRTHQIRVHLNALEHPVVGDPLYKQKKYSYDIERIFLHSHKLGFMDLNGEEQRFISYLPVELKNVLYTITKQHKLFVISGPTGVGKTTLLKKLLEEFPKKYTQTQTYTTREKRDASTEDKVMHYVTEAVFEKMIEQNAFVEWAQVHGNYYGTDSTSVESQMDSSHLIAHIDVEGMKQIMEKFPEAVSVFINVKSIDELVPRVLERGNISEEELQTRLNTAKKEMNQTYLYDYIVYNEAGELENAYTQLKQYMQ